MSERNPPIAADELARTIEWVQRLARALVRGDEAEDLAQDVFSAAIRQPPPAGVPASSWLSGVARNLARLRWRSTERRDRNQARAAGDEAVPTPEMLVERAQAHQLLSRLLLDLDEPFRSTLLLRYFEGLSSAEIARKLGLPAGTVRWRLKRALDELRMRLDQAEGGRRWAVLLTPLGGAPLSPTLVQGVLIVKALQIGLGLLLLLLLCLGVAHFAGRIAPAGDAPFPRARKGVESAAAVPMRGTDGRRDADPLGSLRLEGQVIDEAERPVSGAEVALDAAPCRFVRSAADGSFVFERLISRDYRVEAKSGDAYASSVELQLTATSEPVILRLRRGGTVEVLVRDGVRGGPISGAAVELRSTLTWQSRTDDSGHARLVGVGAGWPTLHVAAEGYAPAARMLRTGRREQSQIVTLLRGGGVAGRVVDGAGNPVGGARIVAEATSEPFPVIDVVRDGSLSASDGSWRFPALAAGSYRFTALHDDFTPASTAPIAIDGEHSLDGVEIRLAPGAIVRGRVVSDSGQPVSSAVVRAVARGSLPWRARDEAFADASGRFVLKGLPARPIDVSASSSDGSSDLVAMDLAPGQEHDVILTISIRGVIEGMVASADGTGVAEARVMAEPERSGALGHREAWEARGIGAVLADGGGRFRFVGLPSGAYRIRAVRPGNSDDALWLAPGVAASVGDHNVMVTVPADGRVRGQVVFKDGGSPQWFSVEIDSVRPEPFSSPDGWFELEAPGGKHDLVVSGPSFQLARAPGIQIKEGSITEVGTITVDKGRSVSGRVLDSSGAPVAGAQVAGGLLLTGNGSQLNIVSEGYRVQETESDASGRYALRGFGEDPLVLVAGRDGVGRSASVRIPRGPSSVEVDLILQPTGSLRGKVTRDGQPLPQVVVIANPRGARSSNFFVTTGEDGSYAFDSLAGGDYVVFPVLGGGNIQPKDMFFEAVTISPGQVITADLAARYGSASASVEVLSGAKPTSAALVLLVSGSVTSPNLESMLEGTWLPAGGQLVPAYLRWAIGSAGARFDGLFAGRYSACAVPLPVDPNDRAAMVAIRDQVNGMPMQCSNLVVSEGAGQTFQVRGPL